MSALGLGWYIMKERLGAGRMMVIWPLLTMFILFSSWGLSDPKVNLPASIVINSAYDVMFVATAFIVFSATMGAVLISFDGVSRDRLSGVLEVKLSQPINRSLYARALLFGHWAAIFLPVMILNLLSVLIIWYRIDDLPSLEELFIHTLGTALSFIVVHFNSVACFIMGQRFGFINCYWIGPVDDIHPALVGFDNRGSRTFWSWSRRFEFCRLCEN